MYEYKFADEEVSASSLDSEKGLSEKLKDIDAKYRINLTNDLTSNDIAINLEKMDYIAPTQEEVNKQASDSLSSYKDTTLKKIDEDYSSSMSKLDNEKNNLDKSLIEDLSGTNAEFLTSVEDAKNRASKRGLTHSSILENQLEGLENSLIGEVERIRSGYSDEIEKLSTQKSLIELQKDNALESFDIAYAVKLSEKLASVNESIEKKKSEVLKYNNLIEEKLAKFKESQIDQNLDEEKTRIKQNEYISDLISTYGTVGIERFKSEEKLALAKSFFDKMSKDEALDYLASNSNFKSLFGTAYNKVLDYLDKRVN